MSDSPLTLEYKDWVFVVKKGGMCSSARLEQISKDLNISVPTVVFEENTLLVQNTKKKGLCFLFTAFDALSKMEKKTKEKTRFAIVWEKENKKIENENWIYSVRYIPDIPSIVSVERNQEGLDIFLLKRKEKFLFFKEIILYEDELDDNGQSILSIKIRVMESFFFILVRCFIRNDYVRCISYETRLQHVFESNIIKCSTIERLKEGMSDPAASLDSLCSQMSVVNEKNTIWKWEN